MKMNRTKRGAAAMAIGASVLTGGALGAAFTSPSGAGAATPDTSSVAASAEVAPQSATTAPAATPPWVSEVLDALVADGTLTQAQRDTVQGALEAAQPQGGPGGGHEGRGGPGGPGGRHGGPGLDAAATALGLSADDLRTALEGGSTIAQVAESKGIDVQVVVDALVADMQSHLAQAVTDGKLTQEQADARAANAAERATAVVNGERPDGPPPGDRQAPADAPADSPSTTES